MPPVSVTMQPRNLPLVEAVVDDELGEEAEPLGLPLDPQAARSPAAPSKATALSVPLTANLLSEAASCRPRYRPLCHAPPRARRRREPRVAPGCPKSSPVTGSGEVRIPAAAAVLRNRDTYNRSSAGSCRRPGPADDDLL